MCRIPPKVRFIGLTDMPSGWEVSLSVVGNTVEEVLTDEVLNWIESTDDQCGCGTYDYFLTVDGVTTFGYTLPDTVDGEIATLIYSKMHIPEE